MQKFSKFAFILLAIILVASCTSQDEPIVPENPVSAAASSPVLDYIHSLGFPPGKVEEFDEYYIVDGDIMFHKDMKLPDETTDARHYRNPNLISYENRNIKIWVNKSSFQESNFVSWHRQQNFIDISLLIESAVDDVIAAYNSSDLGIYLTFQRVANPIGSNVITVSIPASKGFAGQNDDGETGFVAGVCGYGPWPNADGTPLGLINIFPTVEIDSKAKISEVFAHELGHAIGLAHTDVNPGSTNPYGLIPIGVDNGPDAASVMKPNVCGNNWNGLSAGDKQALQCLYGDPAGVCDFSDRPCEGTDPAPAVRFILFETDGRDYLTASAFTGTRQRADGYEWNVIGGYINGGHGTSQINIVPYCPSPRTITVQSISYNVGADGTRCYSSNVATTSSLQYSGRCYLW